MRLDTIVFWGRTLEISAYFSWTLQLSRPWALNHTGSIRRLSRKEQVFKWYCTQFFRCLRILKKMVRN